MDFESTEDSFTVVSESVDEKQKEEPEIVGAPLESAAEESGTATEKPPQKTLLKFYKKLNLSLKHLHAAICS
jgi:hypothetical protein